MESLLEKINICHNNPEKSSTTKINKHTPSGYPLLTHCLFDTAKNKFDYYRSKNCMKNVCLINYEKKKQKKKRKCIITLNKKSTINAK